MVGIVDTDDEVLRNIEQRIDALLKVDAKTKDKYNAVKYADIISHPTDVKYALPITELKYFNTLIMEELTQEEINKIETLGSDWWESPTDLPKK